MEHGAHGRQVQRSAADTQGGSAPPRDTRVDHVLLAWRGGEWDASCAPGGAGAAEVRKSFDTPYALATKKITTDGVDIFVHYADDELARAGDGQRPFREVIDDYLHYIRWDANDDFAGRLQLRQYPDIASVVIDPRFGWGAPVVESIKVPVDAVVDLWRAGESLEDVAYEYGMSREQVEAICRVARTA